MKLLLFANTDARFDILFHVMNLEKSSQLAVCLGNFPLVDKNTPLDQLYKNRFISEGQIAQEFMSQDINLPKFTYFIAGQYDDVGANMPFHNAQNIAMHPYNLQLISKHAENWELQKKISVSMLGGYFNPETIDGTAHNNIKSCLQLRRQHLVETKMSDILLTFESPTHYDHTPKFRGGCHLLDYYIRLAQPKLHVHAHLRDYNIGNIDKTLSIGIPPLRDGYIVIDTYSQVGYVKSSSGIMLDEVNYGG